ncbi:MAG TPA: prenyltransferase/squalene oxidase repeat-containing protein [Terriglobales bacterium]|nr:prenyltransferase/squalene oxidase repeat-containing protein [Terriglobales bacterium]
MISSPTQANPKPDTGRGKVAKALAEMAGLLRGPHRVFPLLLKLASDRIRTSFEPRHLYAYASTTRPSEEALRLLVGWIRAAQRRDGGIAAYYSLLTGYSESYPEVTGYIVPTLYDFGRSASDAASIAAAEQATRWLLSLQMPSGAFPAGLHGEGAQPSVFNTGQILFGLVRAHSETASADILKRAAAAGDFLAGVQSEDGSWGGIGAYQGSAHTYYSMVSWALAQLAEITQDRRHAHTAERNLDWVLKHCEPSGWIDGINLRGHPTYLHFIAYAIQGVLECGILLRRNDAIEAARNSAWVLLRKFETHKHLYGAYQADFKFGSHFACLTGNAQMSCVWLRLFEITGDLRYLNAALKMNELLKRLLPVRGRSGVAGGVAGSYPVWGAYQPLRYISWGCKFLADALLLEQRLLQKYEACELEAAPCVS